MSVASSSRHAQPSAEAGLSRGAGWPLLLLAAPAFVAIWSGWVGLGELTGFGIVHPLPGIADDVTLNTAITLPIGVEAYAAYALRVWLAGPSRGVPARARTFARWSALGSLALGAAGQVAYHLMTAAGVTRAPWPITAAVACLPVAVLGMGAALAHLTHGTDPTTADSTDADSAAPGERADERADVRPSTGSPAVTTAPAGVPRPRGAGGPRSPRPTNPSTTRTTRSIARGADTALRVAQLREQHPDMTAGQIARRLGITDRTVRRHLSAARPAAPAGPTAPAEPIETGPAETDERDRHEQDERAA